jgi:phosphate-selective porin OprO/OprP
MRPFSSFNFSELRTITCTLLLVVTSGLAHPVHARGAATNDRTDGPEANAPAATAAQDEGGTRVDGSQGGVTIASGVNSLTIGARMQFRWTVDDREELDEDETGAGVGRADGVRSAFDVPRMRVTLGGRAFRRWMRYYFQFDFGRTSGDGASKIKDAIFEIQPRETLRILAGQFKAPFGLQQLVSSGRQQFVDRAVTDSKFSPGREMGAMVSGKALAGRIGYEAGVFNGSGESTQQQDESHLYAGRVFFQPLGTYSLAEGGNDAPDSAVVHIGVGARGGGPIRGHTTEGVVQDADSQSAYNIELGVKAPRIFATAEYFWMTDEQQNPEPGPDIDSRGYHAQAGYMVVENIVEVGFRYAEVDGDSRVDDSTLREVRGVVGYYWLGHSLKLQIDFGQIAYGAGYGSLSPKALSGLPDLGNRLVSNQSLSDRQLRLQLQVAF